MKKLILIFFLISSSVIASCGKAQPSNNDIQKDLMDENEYESISDSNNQLGFKLLSILKEENKDNIFISPFSLFMNLSIVLNGADGETKDEIRKALQTNFDIDKLNGQNKKLFDRFNLKNNGMQLNIANSIWLNNQFHLQEDFSNKMKSFYKADIENINITSPESTKRINNWAKEKTNGKIDNIVDYPLKEELVSLFINAIYFKGKWMKEFESDNTENRNFYLADLSTKEVPFMEQKNKWLYLENELFQAISLPYNDENISMKVILPKEQTNLDDLIQKLSIDNWKKWKEDFSLTEGTIVLPKFQLKYEVVLNEALQHLGMKSAFQKNANFNKLIKEKAELQVSKVKQVSYIDVNEEGTEAAAVTSTTVETTAIMEDEPFYMEVNRPFLFMIVDDTTGLILFIGLIEKPIS